LPKATERMAGEHTKIMTAAGSRKYIQNQVEGSGFRVRDYCKATHAGSWCKATDAAGGLLSSEDGTYKTVKARFWPWRAGESRFDLSSCSLFARGRRVGAQEGHDRYAIWKGCFTVQTSAQHGGSLSPTHSHTKTVFSLSRFLFLPPSLFLSLYLSLALTPSMHGDVSFGFDNARAVTWEMQAVVRFRSFRE